MAVYSPLLFVSMSTTKWTPSGIRGARNAAGLTQRGLAELLRVSPAAVAHWESGDTTPNADHQRDLTRVLVEGNRSAGGIDERVSRLEGELRELRSAVTVLQELVGRLAAG